MISNGAVNANDSVTLTGTAPDGATVTVSEQRGDRCGTTTANSTGALELHDAGPAGRRLWLHRHRHDGGGNEHKIERARCDGAGRR